MQTTRVLHHIAAPPAAVYRALLDPTAIASWRVPDDMTAEVHEFEPREGGRFRVSLSYRNPTRAGKTAGATDTYHGRFLRLVDNEQVVEEFEFESDSPDLAGTMTMTTTLTESEGGTDVLVVHEGLPDTIPAADNELGTRMALSNLAHLVEAQP
ncbi:SRPBCC domain-containing protein [Asanoa sp. WMMD1127]|uniref:SRPBCC domain-containing protein n=1 Tax=Asanoa sp. WMMD1127 TaxID=3016107 RepID=UPI0024162CF6|nr:SRPBCC domain-containing protein [Asanoa sp. WMMD1127]MDG4826691.1 SRPBCC domain-containing protein [Asanoa sp. WMMD1127]